MKAKHALYLGLIIIGAAFLLIDATVLGYIFEDFCVGATLAVAPTPPHEAQKAPPTREVLFALYYFIALPRQQVHGPGRLQ